MTAAGRIPSAQTIERVRAIAERRLSTDEVAVALAIPVSDAEREEVLSLFEWFCRRYPTPAERLAYVQSARRRWTRRVTAD